MTGRESDEQRRERQRERKRAWRAANPEEARKRDRERYAAHPERKRWKRAWNLRCYGLTVEEYASMVAKGCVICGSKKRLAVDHDHECCPGRKSCGWCVRGALCQDCNQGLGRFKDSPDLLRLAALYLEANKGGRPA